MIHMYENNSEAHKKRFTFFRDDQKIKLESALCGDANPRRLQRQSCCG